MLIPFKSSTEQISEQDGQAERETKLIKVGNTESGWERLRDRKENKTEMNFKNAAETQMKHTYVDNETD